jgi:hypothetical protein
MKLRFKRHCFRSAGVSPAVAGASRPRCCDRGKLIRELIRRELRPQPTVPPQSDFYLAIVPSKKIRCAPAATRVLACL